MQFERARNKKNKQIRLEQIKDAAKKLFDTMPYHDITLSKIGNEINFTRANLYKYVTSKEDIYLYILLDEIIETINDLETCLNTDKIYSTKDFAEIWTDTFNRHPRFLKLMSLLYMIIEQNADMDTLVYFKNTLLPLNNKVLAIVMHNFPDFTHKEAYTVIDQAMSLIIARYPICNPTDIQLEAVSKSDFDYIFPDFVESYRDGLVLLINGMKLSKI